MLDLSKLTQEYYSIKLVDKTILKIKKPTQEILKTMVEIQNADSTDDFEILDIIYDVMFKIFNRNADNRIFTREEIEEMLPVEIVVMVLKDYLSFAFDVMGE